MIVLGPGKTALAEQEQPPQSARNLIDTLDELLSGATASDGDLVRRLDALVSALKAQYERDKKESVLEEAIFQAPWMTGLACCLEQQHHELMAIARQMKLRLVKGESSEVLDGLREAFDEFVLLFNECEAGHQNLLRESCLGGRQTAE